MSESLKRQVLSHRAVVSAIADLCILAEDRAFLRLTGCLGNFAQKLVSGLYSPVRDAEVLLTKKTIVVGWRCALLACGANEVRE